MVHCGCGAPGLDHGDDATRRGSSLDFAVHTGPGQHTEAFLEVQPGGCKYHESFFDAEGVGDGRPTLVHCGKPVPDLASWDGELTCDCPSKR